MLNPETGRADPNTKRWCCASGLESILQKKKEKKVEINKNLTSRGEKKANPKLIASIENLLSNRKQSNKPVDHEDSEAEAGNAEDTNPSGGDAIGSLVPSAPRHQPHFLYQRSFPHKAPSLAPLRFYCQTRKLNKPHFTSSEKKRKQRDGERRFQRRAQRISNTLLLLSCL